MALVIREDGTILENQEINQRIEIKAHNVTLSNLYLNPLGDPYGVLANFTDSEGLPYKGLKIIGGEFINASQAAVAGFHYSATGTHVHSQLNDGFKIWGFGNVDVIGCNIHNIGLSPGSHGDGIQWMSGSKVNIKDNTIWLPIDIGLHHHNAALFIKSTNGVVGAAYIKNNILNGGNFTVYLEDAGNGYGPPNSIRFHGNRFGRDFRYGPLNMDRGDSVSIRNNRWHDTGELMDIND